MNNKLNHGSYNGESRPQDFEEPLPLFIHPSYYKPTRSSFFTKPLDYSQQRHQSTRTPASQIIEIQNKVLDLMTDVKNLTGDKKSQEYLFLDDTLSRDIEKLDKIEGSLRIKNVRKEAIRSIQRCMAMLEDKAEYNGTRNPSQEGGTFETNVGEPEAMETEAERRDTNAMETEPITEHTGYSNYAHDYNVPDPSSVPNVYTKETDGVHHVTYVRTTRSVTRRYQTASETLTERTGHSSHASDYNVPDSSSVPNVYTKEADAPLIHKRTTRRGQSSSRDDKKKEKKEETMM